MSDDPRALAEKTLEYPAVYLALGNLWTTHDLARALLAALDRAEAAERKLREAEDTCVLHPCLALVERAETAERERDEAWNRCHTCGALSGGGAYGCEECSEFMQEAGYAHKADLERIEADRGKWRNLYGQAFNDADALMAELVELREAAKEVERLFYLRDEDYTEAEGGAAFARLRAALSPARSSEVSA